MPPIQMPNPAEPVAIAAVAVVDVSLIELMAHKVQPGVYFRCGCCAFRILVVQNGKARVEREGCSKHG